MILYVHETKNIFFNSINAYLYVGDIMSDVT